MMINSLLSSKLNTACASFYELISALRKTHKILVGFFLVLCVFYTCMIIQVYRTNVMYMNFIYSSITCIFQVSTEQVVMSHSPLKMFKQFHNMHTLICGQGPIEGIARDLGFSNIITVDQLRELFPYLDMVDHSHRKVEVYPIYLHLKQ